MVCLTFTAASYSKQNKPETTNLVYDNYNSEFSRINDISLFVSICVKINTSTNKQKFDVRKHMLFVFERTLK